MMICGPNASLTVAIVPSGIMSSPPVADLQPLDVVGTFAEPLVGLNPDLIRVRPNLLKSLT